MRLTLRPYQQQAVNDFRDYARKNKQGNPLLVLPTAAGKSLVISKLIETTKAVKPNLRVLVVTHRKELLSQNASKISEEFEKDVGFFGASLSRKDVEQDIIFAQIQSAGRNPKQLTENRNWLLIDEAHRVGSRDDTNSNYSRLIEEFLKNNPEGRIIGLTATPFRQGMGCLVTKEEDKKGRVFDDICHETSVKELLKGEYISPIVAHQVSKSAKADESNFKIQNGDFAPNLQELEFLPKTRMALEDAMKKINGRESVLIYCVTKDHARAVTGFLNTSVKLITDETDKESRANYIEQFKNKKFRFLVSVGVFTEGFDAPNVDAIILLRSTTVFSLYLQILGRGCRLSPGKTECKLLDYGGNVERHGMFDQKVDWLSFNYKKRKKKEDEEEEKTKTCPECKVICDAEELECPNCGITFEGEPVDPDKNVQIEAYSDEPVFSTLVPDSVSAVETVSKNKNRMIKVTFRESLRELTLQKVPIHKVDYYILLDDKYYRQKVISLKKLRLKNVNAPDDRLFEVVQERAALVTEVKIKKTPGKFFPEVVSFKF